MANTWIPSFQSKATFNSISYDITDWTLNDTTNILDATNSGSSQKFVPVDGIHKCTGSVKMNLDALKNPTQQASTAAVIPGQAGTLNLYDNATKYNIVDAMIEGTV